MSRVLIAAVHPSGVIGIDNRIPWHFPADLRRFKRLTMGQPLVMGRRTWESIGRPLPGRTMRVVTSQPLVGPQGVETFSSVAEAVNDPCFVIGGRGVYAEAMERGLVDALDICWVPDVPLPSGETVVRFPEIGAGWRPGPREPLAEDPRLEIQRFHRSDGTSPRVRQG